MYSNTAYTFLNQINWTHFSNTSIHWLGIHLQNNAKISTQGSIKLEFRTGINKEKLPKSKAHRTQRKTANFTGVGTIILLMPLGIYCNIKVQQEEKIQGFRRSYVETDTVTLFSAAKWNILDSIKSIWSKTFLTNICISVLLNFCERNN